MFVFFFFQAEDGIRDTSVTGVQTCALPISAQALSGTRSGVRCRSGPGQGRECCDHGAEEIRIERVGPHAALLQCRAHDEIGRASCRKRVQGAVGAGSVSKKETELETISQG